MTRLDADGFQVHFHALAERAVREALDAIEAARTANGPTDGRHHLAHIQVVHPDDIPRFRELRAVANAQPLWAAHESQMDDLTIPFLGEPRWRWQYPFASLVRAGAVLAMGSDWSVSTPNPLEEIHVAVNRKVPPQYHHKVESDEVFLPEERLDLPTALAAFTMGSAYVNHLDDRHGLDRAREVRRPRGDRPEPVRRTRSRRSPTRGSTRPTWRASACTPPTEP